MLCSHSNIPPPSTVLDGSGRCAIHRQPNCIECLIEDAGKRNIWEWDKDQRRGYCPQPDCGIFLSNVQESEWPDWYRDKHH